MSSWRWILLTIVVSVSRCDCFRSHMRSTNGSTRVSTASESLRCRGINREQRSPNILQAQKFKTLPPQLIGHGYDIHRLSPNSKQPLVIAGVPIEFTSGVVAHSDGDVVYHSVCDAIFGALGLPDIGEHFPDTDPKWRGKASCVFLSEAYNAMVRMGYEVGNINVTLVLEKPKVAPYKLEMRNNLAKLLNIPVETVNVKARTHEKVDAVGRSEAVECTTVTLLNKIDSQLNG